MKKILRKLKYINSHIEETETAIKNIKEASNDYYRPGEKANELRKLNHWLGEMQESKIKVLEQLIELSNTEIQILKGHVKAA